MDSSFFLFFWTRFVSCLDAANWPVISIGRHSVGLPALWFSVSIEMQGKSVESNWEQMMWRGKRENKLISVRQLADGLIITAQTLDESHCATGSFGLEMAPTMQSWLLLLVFSSSLLGADALKRAQRRLGKSTKPFDLHPIQQPQPELVSLNRFETTGCLQEKKVLVVRCKGSFFSF